MRNRDLRFTNKYYFNFSWRDWVHKIILINPSLKCFLILIILYYFLNFFVFFKIFFYFKKLWAETVILWAFYFLKFIKQSFFNKSWKLKFIFWVWEKLLEPHPYQKVYKLWSIHKIKNTLNIILIIFIIFLDVRSYFLILIIVYNWFFK